MIYTKKNPSKEYLQNINYYIEMHENGVFRSNEFVTNQDAYIGISEQIPHLRFKDRKYLPI